MGQVITLPIKIDFLALTYGTKMTSRFSFGITLKHVSEKFKGNNMEALLLDGTFYHTGYKTLRFCASLSHFWKSDFAKRDPIKNALLIKHQDKKLLKNKLLRIFTTYYFSGWWSN